MAKLIYVANVSLDGYIEDEHGSTPTHCGIASSATNNSPAHPWQVSTTSSVSGGRSNAEKLNAQIVHDGRPAADWNDRRPVALVFGDDDLVLPPPAGANAFMRYSAADPTLIDVPNVGHASAMVGCGTARLCIAVGAWLTEAVGSKAS